MDLVIVVADTGIGIAREDLPKVVQPFYQIDSTLSRRHEGTGLGLALVAAIMEQHGGRVVLESEINHGTVARLEFPPDRIVPIPEAADAPRLDPPVCPVPTGDDRLSRSAIGAVPRTLPVAIDQPAAPADSSCSLPRTGDARAGSKRKTILVVDDAQMARDVARRMLERAGFDVVSAVNGRDGLERFRQSAVDAVVTDIMMPEMDGIELTRALVDEDPNVKIVVLSGTEDRINLFKMALQLGAKAALQKPVTPRELVGAVRQVLDVEEPVVPAE
jgi:CheY-like chemotaxis protein